MLKLYRPRRSGISSEHEALYVILGVLESVFSRSHHVPQPGRQYAIVLRIEARAF